MQRCFSIIGDSNVTRNLTKVNCRSNPLMKASQVIPCGHLEVLSEALRQVRAESNVCVLSCITNLFTSIPDNAASPVSHRVEPVLTEFRDVILAACESNPEVSYLVSPPMYRTHPYWYRDGLAEVMTLFSSTLGQERPPNLNLLPSFATPTFESDGVHLTAYSGLEFLLHLFDSAQEVLDSLALSSPEVTSKNTEATRALEDRMMALEQDHRRLVKDHDFKVAVDAELHDWRQNERYEDYMVLKGLALLPSTGLSTKEWQERAVRDVKGVLNVVMGRDVPVVFVQNVTNKLRDTVATYHVQVASASLSSEIRTRFSSFFSGGKDVRPEEVKKIALRNRVTQETHVRISIIHLFGQRYTKANPGSSYKVLGYNPRPALRLFPAPDATDRRAKTFNFIEAIKYLPTNFSVPELEEIIQKVPAKFVGRLRSLFVVLPDDLARAKLRAKEPKNKKTESVEQAETNESASPPPNPAPGVQSGSHTNRKRPPSPAASTTSRKNKAKKS
jgi:hypothetical protein